MTRTEQVFSLLNVSSNPADLLPQARIRLAALELFGAQGFEKTTIRQIATRAGVSPGLVIHHFGSKNQLHEHCDAWALETIQQEKVLLTIGPQPALKEYLAEHPELTPMMDYLVMCLREGGDTADQIYDRMTRITEELIVVAEDNGLVRLPEDREGAIAFLVASSLGFMMMGRQFATRLGGKELSDPAIAARYGLVAAEMFTHGLFTQAYFDALRSANTTVETNGESPQSRR
ncbi:MULTISPECIES: TetR/AcrR family transcriptional regulator [unclassified Luteococcus]|uniref:TetR/AcrR family transcriptional regulator n=1 Tax=unclassified Luteococcus TaxID=2639923 RepID=UPI00313C311A